jgi:hypothetical protein
MVDMFMEFHKNEKNEHTAFVLMLGVISEKLSETIALLKESNKKLEDIKTCLLQKTKEKVVVEEKKYYMPLTAEDYD